jgi:hypothetical protein
MAFGYYDRLSKQAKVIYQESDRVHSLRIENAAPLQALTRDLAAALSTGAPPPIEKLAAELCLGLTRRFEVRPVTVEVLAVRPRRRTSELHGLYTAEPGELPLIQVWMRTAQLKRVVAFRTFLRTLLHETCHHLDFELLRLADSFHTEGFYKRESNLFHQLVPEPLPKGSPKPSKASQPS